MRTNLENENDYHAEVFFRNLTEHERGENKRELLLGYFVEPGEPRCVGVLQWLAQAFSDIAHIRRCLDTKNLFQRSIGTTKHIGSSPNSTPCQKNTIKSILWERECRPTDLFRHQSRALSRHADVEDVHEDRQELDGWIPNSFPFRSRHTQWHDLRCI